MSYKVTRRQWVKLWVNEWLDGTTRFKLTKPQRLLWIDLLALAGRSRFPGFIYAGEQKDGERVGYPLNYLAGVLGFESQDLNNALLILQEHGHIKLSGVERDSLIIQLINWDKYQSEYQRQRAYRKVTKKVTNRSTSRLPVEGDVEGDVEVEGEKPTALFEVFWNLYPRKVGRAKATALWRKMNSVEKRLAIARIPLWKQAEQWHREGGKFTPHGDTFLRERRWEDEPWTGAFAEELQ